MGKDDDKENMIIGTMVMTVMVVLAVGYVGHSMTHDAIDNQTEEIIERCTRPRVRR